MSTNSIILSRETTSRMQLPIHTFQSLPFRNLNPLKFDSTPSENRNVPDSLLCTFSFSKFNSLSLRSFQFSFKSFFKSTLCILTLPVDSIRAKEIKFVFLPTLISLAPDVEGRTALADIPRLSESDAPALVLLLPFNFSDFMKSVEFRFEGTLAFTFFPFSFTHDTLMTFGATRSFSNNGPVIRRFSIKLSRHLISSSVTFDSKEGPFP